MTVKMAATDEAPYTETTRDKASLVSNDSSVNISTESIHGAYKVYKRRWLMLLIVILLNLSNAMVWITFAPIADSAVPYYNIDPMKLNMLSLVYLIASIPFGLLATWLLDTLGLRASLILSAWLNGIGSFLRNVSTFSAIPTDSKYTVVLIGQILAACAQPFVMFAPTKLAALWFPHDQRATANMLASMANPLGILAANVIVPFIVVTPDEIPKALWVVSAPAFLLLVLTSTTVSSSVPPTPPTSSAAEKSEPFFVGLKQLAKNKRYWILNFCFGTGLAIFTALTSFLDQILCPRGYTDNFAGLCAALMIVGGVVGAVVAGLYVDRTKKFEEVVKVSMALSVLFGLAFTQVSRLRNQHALVIITTTLFGVFGFALYPISMELAVEITYPVAEATSSGLAVTSGQLQGVIYMLLMQVLVQDLAPWEKALETGCARGNTNSNGFTPQDWTVPNLFMNGVSVFAVVLLVLFFKGEYKRLSAEQRAAADRILHRETEIVVPT